MSEAPSWRPSIDAAVKYAIRAAVRDVGPHSDAVAAVLGVDRETLYRALDELDMNHLLFVNRELTFAVATQ